MGNVMRKCWVCDVCGHEWKAGDEFPVQCASAKCRSRKWNLGGGSPGVVEMKPCDPEPSFDTPEPEEEPEEMETVGLLREVLAEVPFRAAHNKASCRVYGCLMCKEQG